MKNTYAVLLVAVFISGITAGMVYPRYVHAATLKYQNDFETGWGDVIFRGFCPVKNATEGTLKVAMGDTIPAGHEQFMRTTAHARSGRYSARTILDSRYACWTEPNQRGILKIRSEINMGKDWNVAYEFTDDIEHWYGVSIYVDENSTIANPPLAIMTQFKPSDTISNHLRNKNGIWEYGFEGSAGTAQTSGTVLGAIEKGKWTDFVFHLYPSSNKNGTIEIWVNGVKKFSKTGLDYTSTSPNTGIVAPASSGAYYGNYGADYPIYGDRNLPFVTYIDSVKIAQGPDGYTLVSPSGTPSTGTPPPTPTTCTNTLTSSTAIPTGYGASYNPLTSAREYLIQASCTGTTQATITAGNGNSTTYVYNRGYYYSGTTWTPYTLTCASGALISGAWCPGRATASIPLPQNPQNVIAYTCQYTNSTWKCGCRDSACTSAYWQLQRIGR